MQITIDTNSDLSEFDKQILSLLTDGTTQAIVAPKAAAKTTKAAAAPEPVADEPAPDSGGATLDDAIAAASKLISAGKTADVKSALAKFNAKKVSELTENNIAAFIAALD